jgi:membrane-associated phospholipid phosphatase
MSGQSDLVQLANPNVHEDVERATSKGTFTNRPKAEGPTTLPAFNPVKPTEPYWGQLRPFVLSSGAECAPPAPPAYSEEHGTAFYAMGQQFYDTVRAITPAQKQIALFWADNPVATGTPGFHWISVVNLMVARRQLTADAAVELYTLTSLAIADAFIGCWREKYRSNVVRPVTWVRRVIDSTFQTVIPTPPFPEYPSGHSVQSGAAVDVLIALLGDSIPYIDSTQVDIGQPPRPFRSFSAARTEVAMSRVYAGVHYFPAVVDGLTEGQCIGRKVRSLKTRRSP